MSVGAFQWYDKAFQDDAFDISSEPLRRKSSAGRELVLQQYIMMQLQKDKIKVEDVYDE